jgi:hypothetical protein
MHKLRLLILAAVTAVCVSLTVSSAASADYAVSRPFSCAPYSWLSIERNDCSISVDTYTGTHQVQGASIGARGIWLDSTHALHTAGGFPNLVDYFPPHNNPHWQWRACGWFYHLHAPRHIVCSPWEYEGTWE